MVNDTSNETPCHMSMCVHIYIYIHIHYITAGYPGFNTGVMLGDKLLSQHMARLGHRLQPMNSGGRAEGGVGPLVCRGGGSGMNFTRSWTWARFTAAIRRVLVAASAANAWAVASWCGSRSSGSGSCSGSCTGTCPGSIAGFAGIGHGVAVGGERNSTCGKSLFVLLRNGYG